MSDTQLLAVALATVPTMLVVLVGILINNSRLSDLRSHVDARFNDVDRRFSEMDRRSTEMDRKMDQRFAEMDRKMDQRFDDVKETWRAELHRVEGVIGARLQHLEDRAA